MDSAYLAITKKMYKGLQHFEDDGGVVLEMKSWFRLLCIASDEESIRMIDMLEEWLPRLPLLKLQPSLPCINCIQGSRKMRGDPGIKCSSKMVVERVVTLIEKHEDRFEDTWC